MIIVEKHHYVLKAWAQYRTSLPKAPRLLTLDHHTDTSKPFRKHLRRVSGGSLENTRGQWLEAIHYKDAESIDRAISKLDHDEHVMTAIAADIISSAFVIAHNARLTHDDVYREHKVVCFSVEPEATVVSRVKCDRVLETSFLHEALRHFNGVLQKVGESQFDDEPYILDIDLDYLNTVKSVHPDDATLFQTLVRGAGLITIATEPEHVSYCALDGDLTSDSLLADLKQLIHV